VSSENSDRGPDERRREREALRAARRRAREEVRGETRKESVLHTRSSDRLPEEIRTRGDEPRVPVSSLVRNVLEDVFSVVEVVSDNVGNLVEDMVEEADRVADRLGRRARRTAQEAWRYAEDHTRTESPPPQAAPVAGPEFPEVLGWQPLILNAPQVCSACGRGLARADHAFLGLAREGVSSTYLCRDCAP
jgi:hypothetical protein